MCWSKVDLPSQLKILLDQVDEAVGDFDECIVLRPDSALAQAQKCFALVSNSAGDLFNFFFLRSAPLPPDDALRFLFLCPSVQTSVHRKQPVSGPDGHGRLRGRHQEVPQVCRGLRSLRSGAGQETACLARLSRTVQTGSSGYMSCSFGVFQALTDQQQFGKADEMYDKCIVLEPDNATTYVHKGWVTVPSYPVVLSHGSLGRENPVLLNRA